MKLSAVRAPALVGLMLIGSIAGLIYMVSVVKTKVLSGPDTYLVHATFDDVTGLVENSNVTMVGIPVGIIASITRVQTEQGMKARVGIRLAREVTLYSGSTDEKGELLGAASVIRKQSSILGDYYLSLAPGAFGEPIGDGGEIPVVIGTSGLEALFAQMDRMGELAPRLDAILSNIEQISGGLAEVLGEKEGRRQLKELLGNLTEISAETREVAAGAHRVATEIESLVADGTFSRIANNLEETSADARSIADRLASIVSAGDVEQLVNTLGATADQLNNVGVQLNELVAKGINPRIGQLDRIFRNIERFSADVAAIVEDNRARVTDTIGDLRSFAANLNTLLKTGEGELADTMGAVRGTLSAADQSISRLDQSLENIRLITADVREGKGSVGRLLTDDTLVREIEEVVSDTKGFLKSYTLMQTEVELSSSYALFDRSFKNVFSLRFRPNEDKYYLIQLLDDPRGNTTAVTTIIESDDPTKPPRTEERLQETTGDLKFSFQFARRFYFLVGRFGIMENTGGIGLDFSFFKDRFQFQFDLFDFAMEKNPRLRSLVQWEIIRHFFIAGGADDLFNQDYRDYFMSAGIRFTDNDLKALFFAAPSVNP